MIFSPIMPFYLVKTCLGVWQSTNDRLLFLILHIVHALFYEGTGRLVQSIILTAPSARESIILTAPSARGQTLFYFVLDILSTNAYLSHERTCHSAISLPSTWSIVLPFGYCKAIIVTIDQLKYLRQQTYWSGSNRRVTSTFVESRSSSFNCFFHFSHQIRI